MKHFIISYFIILCTIVACQTQQKEEVADTSPEEIKIDSLVNRYLALERFSGAILVAKEDSIVYTKSFGKADYEANIKFTPQTVFKVGYLSKLVTAEIIKQLAKDGKIELNQKITQYLPEIKHDLIIQDLLDQSSGLPTIAQIKESNPNLKYETLKFVQIAQTNTTNEASQGDLEYNLLGLLIERVTQNDYQKAIEKYADQLDLTNTFYISKKAQFAKGYLYHNYRNQGMELQISPTYKDEEAFSSHGLKTSIQDLFKISQSLTQKNIKQSGYLNMDGFSWAFNKDAKTNMTIIVLSNRRHPVADEISNSISAIYQQKPYELPLLRKVVKIRNELLKDYTGIYELAQGVTFEVFEERDSLFVLMGPNKVALYPQSENQFFMKESDAAMRFIRNDQNKIYKAILYDGFLRGKEVEKLSE